MPLAEQPSAPDTSPMPSGESSRKVLIALSMLCSAGLVLLYGFIPYTYSHLAYLTSVFGALWTMWNFFPDFQHGMIVPFLTGFIVYTRRHELMTLPIKGWWPGIVFVILSLILFWAGRRVDNQYIGFFSFQALLTSLVLWLLGWKWLIALAFPLAFLTFTWPMPFLDNLITFPLRMFMSSMSVFALNTLGIDVVQHGTGIFSAANPDVHLAAGELFQVDVADPCSGIRSLFALMMISALYGYFALKSPWKRVVLFLSSIPLAIVGNLIRILLLTLGIIAFGPSTAIGTLENPTFFHQGAGYAVFLVALFGMLLICWLLNFNRADWHRKWRALRVPISKNKSNPKQRETTDIY